MERCFYHEEHEGHEESIFLISVSFVVRISLKRPVFNSNLLPFEPFQQKQQGFNPSPVTVSHGQSR